MPLKITLLLVVAAMVFSAEWQLIETGDVGRCEYNETTQISEDEPLRLENPCEEWTCDASTGVVSVTRCNPIRPGPGCSSVTGAGAYPACCPRTVCP